MITVLTCNGWSAVYDSTGKRVGEFMSLNVADTLRGLGLTVNEQPISQDDRFTNFPEQIVV